LLSDSSALPGNTSVARNFFKTYKNSIKSRKYEEATKIKTELTDLVENNIDTTAKDMRSFGRKLRKDKLFLESILIFDAASTLSKKIENPENKSKMILFCVQEMTLTNHAMIGEDLDMKLVVKDYVIPLMRDKVHDIESTSSVSKQWKCLQVSWVLHHIEFTQMLVDQLKEAEETQREGLKRMDEVFGENKIKHQVYGTFLNNLSHVCDMTSRYEEAASFLKQAIAAYKAATDYGGHEDEEKRKQDMRRGGNETRGNEETRGGEEETRRKYTSRYEEAASFYKQAIDAYKAAIDYDRDEQVRKRDIKLSENNLRIVQQKIKLLVT